MDCQLGQVEGIRWNQFVFINEERAFSRSLRFDFFQVDVGDFGRGFTTE